MKQNKIRVILADDVEIVRRSMAAVLSQDKTIEVVGTVDNGEALITICEKEQPDVVVVDIQMPVMNGIEAARWLRQHIPDIKTLILTTFDDEDYIQELLDIGIDGYILKNGDDTLFISAVKCVYMGISILAPAILEKLRDMLNKEWQDKPESKVPILSESERMVAELIAKDYYNKDIASELGFTYGGIRNIVSRIYRKLGVTERDFIREYISQYSDVPGNE